MTKFLFIILVVFIHFSCGQTIASDQCIKPSIDGHLVYGPLTEESAILYFEKRAVIVPYSEISDWFNSKKERECIYVVDSPEEAWKRLAGSFGLVSTINGEVERSKVFVKN